MPGSPRQHALPERLTLALVLVGLAVLCVQQGWLWRGDQLIYDAQLRFWSRPAPDDIIIVAIDEASLAQFGRWPWPRQVHAQLLKKIMDESPRAVAFDIIFAEPDLKNPAGDAQFAEAIHASGRVALPVLMEQRRAGGQPLEILPLPALADAAAALGHVHVELDPDGIARRLYLREGLGSPYWPHLSLALLKIAGQRPTRAAMAPHDAPEASHAPLVWFREQALLIPYAGPPGHFRQVSFAQVMHGDYAPDTFRDKLVLIGSTAAGLSDALPTPVSGFSHSMAGVEINANVLDAILRGIHIAPLARGWQLALSGLIALLPMLIFPYLAPRANLLATVALMLAALTLSATLLMVLQRWFPPTSALVTLAVSYPLWSWRRLEQAMRYLSQELDQLHEQEAGLASARTAELERGLEFLQYILPLRGWSLSGRQGREAASQGEKPRLPPGEIPAGQWLGQGDDLWTTLVYRGRETYLGLRWEPSRTPNAREQALLDALPQQFAQPVERSPGGTAEVVQARIQQVQQAAARLRTLRRFVDDSLSNMADGVLVTDALGQIQLSNARAGWYLRGDDDAPLSGVPLTTLLEDLQFQEAGNWQALLRLALLQQARVQADARHRNGRHLLVQIAPLSQDSLQPGGLILNFSDITPLKASEHKRNELLNFLSHDLRSPLVSLLALVELAKSKTSTDEVQALLTRMESYTETTIQLAEQFLQLARAESSQDLPFHELDLVAVTMNALEQVWGQAQAKRIQLRQTFDLDEAWIRGEGGLLERALVNLLSNAIKYSESDRTVGVRLFSRADELYCCVIDAGYGIPAADLPRLFDRFRRVHRRDRPVQAGAGLGLAFVDAVARRHGGRVEVESVEGQGSRFCLILPAPSA